MLNLLKLFDKFNPFHSNYLSIVISVGVTSFLSNVSKLISYPKKETALQELYLGDIIV